MQKGEPACIPKQISAGNPIPVIFRYDTNKSISIKAFDSVAGFYGYFLMVSPEAGIVKRS